MSKIVNSGPVAVAYSMTMLAIASLTAYQISKIDSGYIYPRRSSRLSWLFVGFQEIASYILIPPNLKLINAGDATRWKLDNISSIKRPFFMEEN